MPRMVVPGIVYRVSLCRACSCQLVTAMPCCALHAGDSLLTPRLAVPGTFVLAGSCHVLLCLSCSCLSVRAIFLACRASLRAMFLCHSCRCQILRAMFRYAVHARASFLTLCRACWFAFHVGSAPCVLGPVRLRHVLLCVACRCWFVRTMSCCAVEALDKPFMSCFYLPYEFMPAPSSCSAVLLPPVSAMPCSATRAPASSARVVPC